MLATSLIETWFPRALAFFTASSEGFATCWLTRWYGAGLYLMYTCSGVSGSKNSTLDLGSGQSWYSFSRIVPPKVNRLIHVASFVA